jgi:hypothetical protein
VRVVPAGMLFDPFGYALVARQGEGRHEGQLSRTQELKVIVDLEKV